MDPSKSKSKLPPLNTKVNSRNTEKDESDDEVFTTPSAEASTMTPKKKKPLRNPPANRRGTSRYSRKSGDAFSSSSSSSNGSGSSDSDSDDSSDSQETGSSRTTAEENQEEKPEDFTSEFDKALRIGKQSTGNFYADQKKEQTPPPLPPLPSSSNGNNNNNNNDNNNKGVAVAVRPDAIQDAMSSSQHPQYEESAIVQDPLGSGVLPDVLMTMRQKIESLTLFDSDMMQLSDQYGVGADLNDPTQMEFRESLRRSSQQSISAAVLVSLAHKRYERRRLAAMEIEKVVRSLVQQQELDRIRAILLLLSDDYVRSTSEDARKGGVVALAAAAIGLKKAPDTNQAAQECRDLILASVVHACQDHSQRVRYYATESLFNVVKVIPSLAVQHFFILFEILRSLYADVDVDVKSGAELLDKKLKEVIVGAMNSGSFTADACVPVFARFVYMPNKATKRLTLTWLQELAEKLIGAPILEFLHLFLGGIFDMVADPTLAIRQSALAFLQSVLPKLLVVKHHIQDDAIDDMERDGIKVDFDKILQSLVTTMEHPDPFVRKVAMYWISRIVKAHIGSAEEEEDNEKGDQEDATTIEEENKTKSNNDEEDDGKQLVNATDTTETKQLSAATISVRNSLPHVLPGILLSIGDTFHTKATTKDSFLPGQTTHALAEQTSACLQYAVRRDGKAYVQHLDSFIVALREELDSPGGLNGKNAPAIERKPYRIDVKQDGTGIESQGWFRASQETKEADVDSMVMSRLCALHWIIVLFEHVVPDMLKADYAQEFIVPIIHQLVDNPPEQIIFKSLIVLAKITVPVDGEKSFTRNWRSDASSELSAKMSGSSDDKEDLFPMTENSVEYALGLLDTSRRQFISRDREVFRALIELHAHNMNLIVYFSRVIAYMCRLQPPEFVFVSFAVELERFVRRQTKMQEEKAVDEQEPPLSRGLQFVSSFIAQMCHVLLNSNETKPLRDALKDCIARGQETDGDLRRKRLFHILLHAFSHNLVATTSLCLWGGAFRTASLYLKRINPLDIHLMFLLELDKMVEMIERPLFRHLHVRMLEDDEYPLAEGSGTMLFQTLRSLLMCIPQSTCYNALRDRLVSTSRFRQSVVGVRSKDDERDIPKDTETFVNRVLDVRALHCDALWETIRVESLEQTGFTESKEEAEDVEQREEGDDRREWLGYSSREEEIEVQMQHQKEKTWRQEEGLAIEEISNTYNAFDSMDADEVAKELLPNEDEDESWKEHWAQSNTN